MDNVTVFVRSDLLIYALVVDIIIIVYLLSNSSKQNRSSKLYLWALLAMAFVTTAEAVSWLTGEIGNTAHIPVHYWSNAVFLALMGLPAAMGMTYLDYKIFKSEQKSKKRLWIYLMPTYFSIGCSIYNIFNSGFLFYIADNNQYHRGIGITISVSVIYLSFIIVMLFFLRHRKKISGRIASSMMVFGLLPVLGALLQMLAYGTTLGMPSYTLAALIIFLILEKDEMGKDEMTGLYTRVKIEDRLRYKLKTHEPFSVIMADLNDFKEINDTFGHAEGDKALKAVAHILSQVVNVEDMVCRYGGDEFLILIEYKHDICKKVIDRIDNNLAKCCQDSEYNVSLSYGFEHVENPSSADLDELLKRVDRLMYQNKDERKKLHKGLNSKKRNKL